MRRYARAGAVYDVLSLERLLYRRPRARLAELFDRMPGATVVDLGCGTGQNLAWLHDAVMPGGRVIGVDQSPSMLAAARRRVERHGWADVQLVEADLTRIDVPPWARDADAFVATFVLSLLADDTGCWTIIDAAARSRAVRVAVADLGEPADAGPLVRPALRAVTALGGGNPHRRPWRALTRRATDPIHEVHLRGHVHLAVGDLRLQP